MGHDAGADYNAIADRIYIEGWALAFMFGAVDQGLAAAWWQAGLCAILSAFLQFVVIRWSSWLKAHPDNDLIKSIHNIIVQPKWWIATLSCFLLIIFLSPYVEQQRFPFSSWVRGPSATEIADAVVAKLLKVASLSSSDETGKATPSTEKLQTQKPEKVTPNPHDIPQKLGLLDEAWTFLPEIQKYIEEAAALARRWEDGIKTNKSAYLSDIRIWRKECNLLDERLNAFRQKASKFDDIQHILDCDCGRFSNSLSNLAEALNALGDPPTGNYRFLIGPYDDAVANVVKGMDNCSVRDKILALRKSIAP